LRQDCDLDLGPALWHMAERVPQTIRAALGHPSTTRDPPAY
jgi:hypothetical protein